MINSFLKLEERLPPIRAHRPGGSRSAARRGRLVPHLNTPLCIFLQPLGAKALHKANLEIHPLAQQVHWVSNHIFLTTCSVNRRGKHWSQVTMGPSKWDWCQWRLHRCLVCISHSVVVDSVIHGLQPGRLLCPWNSPDKNTGVAIPFSRGSSWPRDRTHVSCIAGGFFTISASRKAPETTWGDSKGYRVELTQRSDNPSECGHIRKQRYHSFFLEKRNKEINRACPGKQGELQNQLPASDSWAWSARLRTNAGKNKCVWCVPDLRCQEGQGRVEGSMAPLASLPTQLSGLMSMFHSTTVLPWQGILLIPLVL